MLKRVLNFPFRFFVSLEDESEGSVNFADVCNF